MITAQLLSMVSICFLKEKKHTTYKEFKSRKYLATLKKNFFKADILKIVIFGSGVGGAYSVYMIYLPLILSRIGLSAIQISLFFIIQMIMSFLLTFFIGKIAEDSDSFKICFISCVFFLMGGLMNFSDSIILNIMGGLICCVGGNLFFPAITSIINNIIPNEIRTIGNSIVNMVQAGFMCILLCLIGFLFK